MFNSSSVMILTIIEKTIEIFKLELKNGTQQKVTSSFAQAVEELVVNKEKIEFDGCYKPNGDEYLSINNFQMEDKIKDAVRDPLGVRSYEKVNGQFPEIKAVFVGEREEAEGTEKFIIAFQRFRKEQYISTKGHNLFFENNTFFLETRYGICISENIDCFFTGCELQFNSFFFARQVFDLSEYYRSATDREVRSFTVCEKLMFENTDSFKIWADSWIRRKIALINDSCVLENYTASKIKSLAKAAGVEITVENKKIIIPADKGKIKIILGFLDEEAYKGPFSQTSYLVNSKRKFS